MRFCPNCDNLLMPKKDQFYCRACGNFYNLEPNAKNEYVLLKRVARHKTDLMPIIIKEPLKEELRISYEDRKAFEDYFDNIAEV